MSDFLTVDLTGFAYSARQILKNDWPNAVVDAFSEMAAFADNDITARTKQVFGLHSDYIPRGIRHYPDKEHQKNQAAHALEKYGDMNAAVFLRGARTPKHALDFMVHHETGERKEAFNKKTVAVPTKTALKKSGFKTSRGKIRTRWKPARLLEQFNENSTFDGNTTRTPKRQRKRRYPGHAFLIKGPSGSTFIARAFRRSMSKDDKNLEFLYILKPSVAIDKRWKFEDTVHRSVQQNHVSVIQKHVAKMKDHAQ